MLFLTNDKKRFGQTLILPIVGATEISSKGEVDLFDDIPQSILESIIKQLSLERVIEKTEESVDISEVRNNLLKSTVANLQGICVEAQYEKKEWQFLSKEKLVDYLIEKNGK